VIAQLDALPGAIATHAIPVSSVAGHHDSL
jgi:hypothetical protein